MHINTAQLNSGLIRAIKTCRNNLISHTGCSLRVKHRVTLFELDLVIHGKQHSKYMGAPKVPILLTHLAICEYMASATQKQALLVFIYEKVLLKKIEIGDWLRLEKSMRLTPKVTITLLQ